MIGPHSCSKLYNKILFVVVLKTLHITVLQSNRLAVGVDRVCFLSRNCSLIVHSALNAFKDGSSNVNSFNESYGTVM